jgi:hypothetical protein
MGAQPIGAPGWPEFAACTMSAERQRTCGNRPRSMRVRGRFRSAAFEGWKERFSGSWLAVWLTCLSAGWGNGEEEARRRRQWVPYRVNALCVDIDLLLLGGGFGHVLCGVECCLVWQGGTPSSWWQAAPATAVQKTEATKARAEFRILRSVRRRPQPGTQPAPTCSAC